MNKNRPSSTHPKRLPRTNVLYWRNKVEQTVSQSGATNTSYSVRIEWKTKRVRFPLHSSNKNEAANKALEIFRYLNENGWDATIAKYKSKHSQVGEEAISGVSVGDLIRVAQKYSTVRQQTFNTYSQALRKIAADIAEIPEDGKHKPAASEEFQQWRTAVDAVPLAMISPSSVQAWRQKKISAHSQDASERQHATVTANSQIRNAKAFFSKKLLPFVQGELELPSPLPFENVQAEKIGSLRYHSQLDAKKLLELAKDELATSHPESFTVFLLALLGGLRVSEIDHLLWEAIDFDQRTLHVKNSRYHQLKSDDSEGVIDLGEYIYEHLQELKKQALNDFVIPVSNEGEVEKGSGYRCKKHLKSLIQWLREKGMTVQKPIHTLRKEIGSIVAKEQGIYAASRYLRHADIQVTAAYYLDKKKRVVPSLGN